MRAGREKNQFDEKDQLSELNKVREENYPANKLLYIDYSMFKKDQSDKWKKYDLRNNLRKYLGPANIPPWYPIVTL